MTKQMRAVVYTRVSSLMQERDGVSLPAQLDMAKKYCEARGWQFVGEYCDVMSGRTNKRPDLERLEADADARRFDTVIVYKLDRLSRSAYHYYQLMAKLGHNGIDIASLTQPFDTSTASGRFMLGALILLAQMESEQIGERVADNIRYRAGIGRQLPAARPPLGYCYVKSYRTVDGEKVPGYLELEEDEVEVARQMFTLFLELRSCAATAKQLNALGYRTKEGRLFDASNLKKLLQNPIYCGDLAGCRYAVTRASGQKRIARVPAEEWIVTRDAAPAIVSRDDWELAQVCLKENERLPARAVSSKRKHPWSGLLRCGGCGGPMVRSSKREHHSYYRCRNASFSGKGVCQEPGGVAEGFLDGVLLERLFQEVREADRRARTKLAGVAPPAPKVKPDRAQQLREIDEERRRINRVYFRVGAKAMTDDEYDQAIADLDRRAAQLNDENDVRPVRTAAPVFPEDIRALWDELPAAGRGDLLRLIVNKLEFKDKLVTVHFHNYETAGWPQEPTQVPIRYTRNRKSHVTVLQ